MNQIDNKSPDDAPIPKKGKVGVTDVISMLHSVDGKLANQEQKVADYVKSNLENISNMTIAQLAERSSVSTPTVIRFCRSLGCEGFREFKLRLAQNVAVSLQYLNSTHPGPAGNEETAVDQVLNALYATTSIMRKQINLARLIEARDAIVNCRQLVVGGIGGGSSMMAEEAVNRIFRLGIPASSINDSYMMQMRSATLDGSDVLLLFSASGEADAVVAAARIAGGYGATVVSVTKSDTSLSEASDISISVEIPEDPDIFKPTASRYAFLAILDTLAMLIAQVEPETTRENLRRIRASLTAYHSRTGAQPLGD